MEDSANTKVRGLSGERAVCMGSVHCPGEGVGVASQGISEGVEDGRGLRNKTVIKINEAKKLLEILESGWL